MTVAIGSLFLGLYCLLVAPRYFPMLGFRGALYCLQVKNSWGITNKIFGLFLLISRGIYLISSDLKIFIFMLLLGMLTTDLLSFLLLKINLKIIV
ncbi:hypothetical protein ACYSNW_15000 [Enterococcus sp. LJL99]